MMPKSEESNRTMTGDGRLSRAFLCLLLLNKLRSIMAGQCQPFQADVYLPFDDLNGTTIKGEPLASTADGAVILTPNTEIGMGNAAEVDGSKIHVLTDSSHSCFFDPMDECTDGFLLSLLIKTYAGQQDNQVYLSSGADASNSWGFALTVHENSIEAHIKTESANGISEAVAEDTTYVYNGTVDSPFMQITVSWNATNQLLELYRDGVLRAQDVAAENSAFLLRREYSNFYIGQANNEESTYGKGQVDELLYFYQTKSAAFIGSLYSNYDNGTACKSSCINVENGLYQSCLGCNMYVECVDDNKSEHVCPTGYYWQDTTQTCVYGRHNATCHSEIVKEIQTDPCIPNECYNGVCENGATCMLLSNGFNCTCVAGYEGGYCEIDINECESNPCLFGVCLDQVNQYECNCTAGFYGSNCEEYDGCHSNPCLNAALNCTDTINGSQDTSFNCTCAPGYTSDTCGIEINECESGPCVNNGTCDDFLNGYNCSCLQSYGGEYCEEEDECYYNPCLHNGTCSENSTLISTDYTCSCQHGFSGRNCEMENECLTENVICQNGGFCDDLDGAWNCSCLPGFNGTYCEENIDECAPNPCVNGHCYDLINHFNCTCVPGYQGVHCDDYDYCYNQPCVNGSCEDFDDNLGFTYNCTCDYGFSDVNCSTENECLTENVVCSNEGDCQDLDGNHTCVNCSSGYVGWHCEVNYDECLSSPCQNGATCHDFVDEYNCTCAQSYIGHNCEQFDDCFSGPCQNGGICQDTSSGYTCDCGDTSGWYGTNCTLEDECTTRSVVCQNNGNCTDNVSSPWQCQCDIGFWGDNCEYRDMCVTVDPCDNGTCLRVDNGYSCACAEGYTGTNCSDPLHCVLQSVQCQNGGQCENEENGWSCQCPETHIGDMCETDNPCHTADCDVTGTRACEPENATLFQCQCYDDFSGDDCATGPCNVTDDPFCHSTGTKYCAHYSNGSIDCVCYAIYSGDSCSTTRALSYVEGRLTMDLAYISDLADSSSSAYTTLAQAVTDGIFGVCECEVEVSGFTSGSVVVAYVLGIVVNTNVTELQQAMAEAATIGTLIPPYTVLADSISITDTNTGGGASAGASSVNTTDDETSWWRTAAYITIVFLALAAVVFVFVIVIVGKVVKQPEMKIHPSPEEVKRTETCGTTATNNTTVPTSEDDVTIPPASPSISAHSRPTTSYSRPKSGQSRPGTSAAPSRALHLTVEDEWQDKEVQLQPSNEVAAASFETQLIFRGRVLPSLTGDAAVSEEKSRILSGPVIEAP